MTEDNKDVCRKLERIEDLIKQLLILVCKIEVRIDERLPKNDIK